MKLIIVTIGFDEGLPLRGLLKTGIDVGDTVLLVYSKSGGEFEVKKVEKAVDALKTVVSKTGVKVVDVVVSGMDFYADTGEVIKAVKSQHADEIVAVLAGGMRLTIFEVVVAVLTYHRLTGVRTRIHLMREDGLYDVTLPGELLFISPPMRCEAVFKALDENGEMKRNLLVDKVSRETGLTESMTYKLVKEMVKKGLLRLEGDTVKMTELGRLMYEAVKKG